MAANVNFWGTPSEIKQLPIQSPGQMGVQNQFLQNLMQLLQQGPTAGFQPIEDRARSQFHSQTIPSIAERFTAMGGGQRSSAFQGALGSASSDLEQGLAALKAQYGLQQQGQLSSLLNAGLQPQFENLYLGEQQGGAQKLAQQFGPAAFELAGQSLGQDASSGEKWARALGTLGTGASIGATAGGPIGAGVGVAAAGIIEALRNLFGGKSQQPQQQQFANPALNTLAKQTVLNKYKGGNK